MRTTLTASFLTLGLALACGTGGPAPAPDAAEVAPPPTEAATSTPEQGWMVIVAGDADQVAARAKYDAYAARGPAMGDFPALVDSSQVEGLNPGFHIVVAGIPRDEQTARQMATALGREWEGAYVREVRTLGVEDVSCPGDPRCGAGGWKVLLVFDYTDGMESEDWASFTDEVISRASRAGIDARWESGELREPVTVGGD